MLRQARPQNDGDVRPSPAQPDGVGQLGVLPEDAAKSHAELWQQRLFTGFEQVAPRGYLPLAEEAIKACPGDLDIFMLAANAALLDGQHERALVFLKRFSKRAESPSECLLRALALNLAGKRSAARQLLERNRLSELPDAFVHYPAGRPKSPRPASS